MTGCKTIEQIRTLAGAILWNGQMTEKSKQSLLPHLHLSQRASVYAEPRLSSACNLHEDIDRYSTTLHFMGTWNVKMQAEDKRPFWQGRSGRWFWTHYNEWDYNGRLPLQRSHQPKPYISWVKILVEELGYITHFPTYFLTAGKEWGPGEKENSWSPKFKKHNSRLRGQWSLLTANMQKETAHKDL